MDYIHVPTGDPALDTHLQHVRNVDWAFTPLGPLDQWPREMALFLQAFMTDPFPRLLVLGRDSNMLYNPGYGKMIGELHPKLLGMSVFEGWPDQADQTRKTFEYVRETGRPHDQSGAIFHFRRDNVFEETILRWCTIALKGPFEGFYVCFTDVTDATVGEKRRAILRNLSDSWLASKDITSLWSSLSQSISVHPHEFPFALFYSAALEPSTEQAHDFTLDAHDASRYILRGFVGNSSAQPLIQKNVDPNGGKESYLDAVRQAVKTKTPGILNVADGKVPESWIRAAHGRGYGDRLEAAVTVSITSNRTGATIGFIVLGLNTRRPWNDQYRDWITDLGRKVNDSFTALLLAEHAARKQHEQAKQAAREQVLLAKELATREREANYANDKAQRLLKMMQDCDVGIFEYDPDGTLVQANDAWYQLSGHPRPADMHKEFSFLDCVYEDDVPLVIDTWNSISKGNQVTFEMRWKAKQSGPVEEPPEDGQWVLSSCIPVYGPDGNIIAISGCTTNIGPQKRSVRDAVKRAEALERARASEEQASLANERFQRMTKAVDLIDVGVFEYHPDGTLVSANDAYYSISGIKPSDKTPMTFTDALYPEDLDQALVHWAGMLKGIPANFEIRWKAPYMTTPGGQDPGRWTLAGCVPTTDEHGKVTSIFGCITDIDAQKRAETETRKRAEALERARALERRFLRFTESSAVPIYILEHPSKKATYCNDAWFALTGLERGDYNHTNWRDVIHQDDLPLIDSLWDAITGRKETVSIQFRLKRMWSSADGREISPTWVMATANPEFNEDGSVKGIMGTMSDITGFKWAETSQQVRINEAIEAKRQQENFIDMTSHEIRNPLGAIVHCTDSITDTLTEMRALAKKSKSSEDMSKPEQLLDLVEGCAENVTIITSCSSHMLRIANDILVLSKLDANLLQIAPSATSIRDLLRDIEHMFVPEANRSGVLFKTEMDNSINDMGISYVLLDAGRALQILINLVTNAIKFTKNSEMRQVTIRMGASSERPSEEELHVDFALSHSMRDSIYETVEYADNSFYIWFTVQDTGRGMTADEKAKIFSRFTQGSPRTYSEYGGSGLGLFISRELAGLQGGEIGVASVAGVGSTFAFFVRSRHSEAPKAELADLPVRSFNGSVAPPASPREVSVLVTEDNLLNQKVLKKQLLKHGYKVYTADNGQEALDFLKGTKRWNGQDNGKGAVDIDVVLMDIEMPIMGGLEAASRIRQYQEDGSIKGHIPIIAVSANARAEQTTQALAAGMDDAISKPFRIVDLIPKVDKMASWAKMTRK